MLFRKVTVQVLVNGRPIDEYRDKDNSIFIEGRPKSNYSIRLINHNNYRVKAVVSVDGLSVLDGELADTHGRGYIIPAMGTTTIDGWRTSVEQVNQFVFGGMKDSYSAKTGHGTSNVGVIGVALTSEKAPDYTSVTPYYDDYFHRPYILRHLVNPTWTHYSPIRSYSMSKGVGIASNVATYNATQNLSGTASSLGTGFGDQQTSFATTTEFREGINLGQLAIYYDDRRGLERRGIVLKRAEPTKPNPFPNNSGFCKPV